MKFSHLILPLLVVLALTACRPPADDAGVALQPVPFTMLVPSHVAARLSLGKVEGPFGEAVKEDGALAATTVYYQPSSGERTIFMTAYFFPADKFDALQNPDEPPLYGFEVIRSGGHVLSVAGPQDSIFAPDSPDGRNLEELYGRIYLPATYRPTE
jgi:hypothetical protein